MSNVTPMMQQYLEIKEKYKDCILFFRLGDFYEMFFEDAIVASKELEITLTGRDCGLSERAPMCGVPFHSADSYILKLINKNYKVAICEQIEDPSEAKGIVKRDVIRVITPGTVFEPSMLDEKKNNYLVSIYKSEYGYGIAAVDLSTGDFLTSEICSGNIQYKIIDEIARYSPSEIIITSYDKKIAGDFAEHINKKFKVYITLSDYNTHDAANAADLIIKRFGKDACIGSETNKLSVIASGVLIDYLEKTQKVSLDHLEKYTYYNVDEYMLLDVSTRRNLEITETMREKSRKGSLLSVIDRTMTSMGARTLKKWLEQPLIKVCDIDERLEAVAELKEKFMVRSEIRELLKRVYDIERLMGKVVLGSANARDLVALKNSLGQIPFIKNIMENLNSELLVRLRNQTDNLCDVYELLESAIIEEPPVSIKDGGIIKTGFNEEIDELRKASTEGKNWIADLEAEEREKTGIKNLKVGFNKIFGYYIEVTKSNYNLVPDNYIRKQTLANCERYITEKLKNIEEKVLGAEEKLLDLEYKVFIKVRESVSKEVSRIKNTAKCLSELDVLCSYAELADRENYVRPVVSEDDKIYIVEGRHPVVEKMINEGTFVPNDTYLDLEADRLNIITGPNMAGKSTYLRQVALIVLLAQAGCFVPAKSAKIGIVDRIFTRVGASDDLAAGQSTFMVEMNEVANILNNATSRSLLILDEIGRGTSTFDGLSIAWAVIEYVCDKSKIGARTLFATHYHELTELEGKILGVKNYFIMIKEIGEDIIFLRKIARGGADGSYGIQVAKLAGLPKVLIERAKQILRELEESDINNKKRVRKSKPPIKGQVDLFSLNMPMFKQNDEVINEIMSIDITKITPLEALNVLNKLKGMIMQ